VISTLVQIINRRTDRELLYGQSILPILFLLLFGVLPVIFIVMTSFMRYSNELGYIVTVTLENYQSIFESGRINVVFFTIRVGLVTAVLAVAIAYPISYFVYRYVSEKNKIIILLILVLPFIVNRVIRIQVLTFALSNNGLVNQMLFFLPPLDLLHRELALYLGFLSDTIPISIILIWISFERIDKSLLRANADLGGSRLFALRKIIFPLGAPGVVASVILIFSVVIGGVVVPQLFGGPDIQTTGQMLASTFNASRFPLASAISVFTILAIAALLLVGQRVGRIMTLFEEFDLSFQGQIQQKTRKTPVWLAFAGYTSLIYGFLLLPLVYAVYLSFFPTPSPIILVPDHLTLEWYTQAFQDPLIIEALQTSVLVSLFSALSAVVLSLVGGRVYMKVPSRIQQSLLLLFLIPALIPGIVVGLGLVIFFNLVPIETGLLTLVVATLLWSLPFAILAMLTSMANLNQSLRRASYDLGESRFMTFKKVEYPIIFPGVLGAFLFSFLFSFNEYIRSSFVAGRGFTIPIFLYSSIRTGGIPETLFATSTVLVLVTTGLLVLYITYDRLN